MSNEPQVSLGRIIRTLLVALAASSMLLVAILRGSLSLMIGAAAVCAAGFFIAIFGFIRRNIIRRFWNGRIDMFAPWVAFPIAYVIWFSVGTIDFVELPRQFAFGLFDPMPSWMWGMYALGLAGYLLGACLVSRSAKRFVTSQRSVGWNYQRALAVIAVVSLVALISWVLVVTQYGIPALSSDAAETRLDAHGIAYVLFQSCTWTVLVLLPLVLWMNRPSLWVRWVSYTCMGISALLLGMMAARTFLVIPAVTAIVVRHYARIRYDLRKVALTFIAAFGLLSLGGFVRDYSFSQRGMIWIDRLGIPNAALPVLYSGLYIRYSVATLRDVTEIIPSDVPYQHGALTFMPFKTFLPGRQEMSDVYFKRLLNRKFAGSGEPATMLGPLYADWGLLGVFLGMLVFGTIYGWSYRTMLQQGAPLQIAIYGWLTHVALLGLFANLFPYISTILIPLMWAFISPLMASRRGVSTVSSGELATS